MSRLDTTRSSAPDSLTSRRGTTERSSLLRASSASRLYPLKQKDGELHNYRPTTREVLPKPRTPKHPPAVSQRPAQTTNGKSKTGTPAQQQHPNAVNGGYHPRGAGVKPNNHANLTKNVRNPKTEGLDKAKVGRSRSLGRTSDYGSSSSTASSKGRLPKPTAKAKTPTKSRKAKRAEEEAAAVKIQAGARGYLARKKMKEQQAAATKIQANYRGYRTRKRLKKEQAATSKKDVRNGRSGGPRNTRAQVSPVRTRSTLNRGKSVDQRKSTNGRSASTRGGDRRWLVREWCKGAGIADLEKKFPSDFGGEELAQMRHLYMEKTPLFNSLLDKMGIDSVSDILRLTKALESYRS